jgi:hypothetical protein
MKGFKKLTNNNSLGFKISVLKHFIPLDFQRWFLNKGYRSSGVLGKHSHQGHQTHELGSDSTHFPWEVIKALLKGKVPDIDGVPMELFQEYMDTTSMDLWKAIMEMLDSRSMPIGLNTSLIVLIPKTRDCCQIGNWRPITFLSNVYKILVKLLA